MRILWTNHFDQRGSGYLSLSIPICSALQEAGHEVKVLGLEYRGEEVSYPFSVIPAATFQDVMFQADGLRNLWKPDVFIAAFDLPVQQIFLDSPVFKDLPYIGIFPIESDPLCLPYAMLISRMTVPCVISKFGIAECDKFGIPAKYFEIALDPEIWRVPSEDERNHAREAFGLTDQFTVLTVADNQERKNLSRSMEIFSAFHAKYPNSRYVLVTREKLSVGWELRDLARVLGIGDVFQLYERGMDVHDLWTLYAAADVFLLTSKAEGAGIPILEAMAIGLPVIGTDCTAIHEHLEGGRGFLIPWEFDYIDPFMNGRRYFASREKGIEILTEVYQLWLDDDNVELDDVRIKAFKYVENRKRENSVSMIMEALNDCKKSTS